MSAEKKIPAAVHITLAAFAAGVLAAGGCMAGAAALMVRQGFSQAAVWPLATACVCLGSVFSGWISAFLQKKRGLACGAVQGGLFAAVLLALAFAGGSAFAEPTLLRIGLAFVFGCVGGFLGMLRAERKHRRTA